ncbi:MAG: hypothetical protein DWQ44_08260 [Bacteroidetes bacterium]|nr:MAG: hypothetical protein DWQ33_01660 [Bacteroidota bacterium]REK07024.1 MAG: hypothetical protein DWQ39_02430 [Bacteroidota bacterium]REK33629.1 MAG: hypothetical protein DWQ44_08260 [Bacteroidota bacterium]REK48615.1 MAG: hypothetical protein DWQ48_09700 [Bacteroidota bacterium]
MRKFLFYSGIFIAFISLISIIQYGPGFNSFSEYGQGYFFGKIIMLIFGLALVFIFRKPKLKS